VTAAPSFDNDASNGWEAVAAKLIEWREQSRIGVGVVRTWARALSSGASILDLGCGSGMPISKTLMDEGFIVSGIDASPTLVAAFRSRFPGADVACEPAETSRFFSRTFDAAIAVGLIFLLPADAQKTLLLSIGSALNPGGRLLFTSPSQSCEWADLMTGRQSRSLGTSAYLTILSEAGLTLTSEYTDEGENHYYDAIRK
jgi:SAM-dependent methyltransferase